jgi:hypothetical protein
MKCYAACWAKSIVPMSNALRVMR